MLTLKLRFKKPDEDVSVKREFPVKDPGKKAAAPSGELEWQAAVAAFGMVLRNSQHKGQADLRLVRELAMGSRGKDPAGRRKEFIDLVSIAEKLATGEQISRIKIKSTIRIKMEREGLRLALGSADRAKNRCLCSGSGFSFGRAEKWLH